eukprot:GHVR01185786.1.p1 GENE.GHVR01185786.1~~GHVR01185786.1.p1  ORF type:complete len:174 (-),score=11.91 GHVR01185786.1:208-729(-)
MQELIERVLQCHYDVERQEKYVRMLKEKQQPMGRGYMERLGSPIDKMTEYVQKLNSMAPNPKKVHMISQSPLSFRDPTKSERNARENRKRRNECAMSECASGHIDAMTEYVQNIRSLLHIPNENKKRRIESAPIHTQSQCESNQVDPLDVCVRKRIKTLREETNVSRALALVK